MDKIFISYAHSDQPIAERILSELRHVSVEGWRDAADLAAGNAISTSLLKALRRSSAIVVLLSPKSLASKWLLFEVGAAQGLGKRIIPVIIKGEDIERSIPEPLQGFRWLDARNKPPHEAARQIEATFFYNLACYKSLHNYYDKNKIIDDLRQAITLGGTNYRDLAEHDLDFKSIREDPDFRALIEEGRK